MSFMKTKVISAVLLCLITISSMAQTSIIIPPKKDNSGITQVYQKKRQQVVSKLKNTSQTRVAPSSKIQGICVSQVVDLGLSVKWAGWNLGANSPEQKGGYYGWADSQGINRSLEDNQYPSATPPGSISGTQYDTARRLWGNNWRMPNAYEMLELYNECKWEWTTFKSVYGAKITGPNGNAIFLPAAGYREGYDYGAQNEECTYWSGSLDPTDPSGAFCVAVEKEGYSIDREFYPEDRHLGLSIRPVYDNNMPMVDLSPEEFQQMGMAGAETNLATYKIKAISSIKNGNWTKWDTSFQGTFLLNKLNDRSNARTIAIRQDSREIVVYLLKEWGQEKSDGNGGYTTDISCAVFDSKGSFIDVKCVLADGANGGTQFVCPINGITYSFWLTE